MNVVFIVLDTARKDKISVYNDEVDFTENLEGFANDAKVFRNAVSQAPWTLPSHASMFTGEYPWKHNATQRKLYLETDKQLLAEKFESNGYETACYTSNTWISPYTGMAEGFQDIDNFFGVLPSDMMSGKMQKVWRRLNRGKGKWLKDKIMQMGEKIHWMETGGGKKTPQVIDSAEQFIETCDDEFFLFLNFMDCHLPYEPPEEYKEEHAPDVNPDEICQKAHDHNGGLDEADFEASEKLYNAEMDYLDDQLGRLFEFFKETDLVDETVFVIVSDHGENLGEDNLFGHQFSVSENLVSVPLVVKAPNLMNNDMEDQVELRELYQIVPWLAGLEDKPSIGVEFSLGGYEHPELDLKNIPEEKHEELGQKLCFVRGRGKKLVRKGSEDRMIDLQTSEHIEIEDKFVELIDDIGDAESGQMIEGQEEEVKERLEELGYI